MTGRWVQRGLVKVWEATPSPALDVAQLIACPTCRARVTQSCRSSGGHPRAPHSTRLVSRRCACGSLLERKKSVCTFCRHENDQASKNAYGRRRTREKRAA